MIGRQACGQLFKELLAESAVERSRAADSVTDIVRSYDAGEVRVLGALLAWLALTEVDELAQEAQLNALGELYANTELPLSVVSQVLSLDRETLPVAVRTQYDDLAELIEQNREAQ